MAAYQCLNCRRIERSDEACCATPDLFCINDMPGEIVRLRSENAALREAAKDPHAEHWAAISDAGLAIGKSPECSAQQGREFCAAIDRLADALMQQGTQK